jgi:hypothetical protein
LIENLENSEWKIINSYEGGCPANVPGNMDGGFAADHSLQLRFTIPEGIESGKYTLAWTWFNRLGNREMYMDCAPITGVNDACQNPQRTCQSSGLLFLVANINGCMTRKGVEIRFTRPGTIVEYNGEDENRTREGEPAVVV